MLTGIATVSWVPKTQPYHLLYTVKQLSLFPLSKECQHLRTNTLLVLCHVLSQWDHPGAFWRQQTSTKEAYGALFREAMPVSLPRSQKMHLRCKLLSWNQGKK